MLTGHAWATVVAVAFAAYLAIALPAAACLGGPALRRRLAAEPSQLAAFHREAIIRHWVLAGVAVGVVASAAVPLAAIGLRMPVLAGSVSWRLPAGLVALASAVLLMLAHGAMDRALLPSGPGPRRRYVALALTAGCVEELLYRGFLMLVLTDVAGCGWQLSAAVSALAFGIAHGHQGPSGVAAATLAGWGLAEVYLGTGSLAVPIVGHVAIGLWPLLRQKWSGASAPSMRSPRWKTVGPAVSTPSPATKSRVGAVGDAR